MVVLRSFLVCIFILVAVSKAYCQLTYSQAAAVSGDFRDVDDDGIFDVSSPAAGSQLLVRYFPFDPAIPEQDRAIVEFDISLIPDNAEIVSAELSFTTTSFVSPIPEQIEIVGYSGDGIATLEDAEIVGISLAVFENETLDKQLFAIDTNFISDALESDFAGIRFQSAGGNVNTGIRNIDNESFFNVPVLTIEYETKPGKTYSQFATAEESFRDNEDDGIYDNPSPSSSLLIRYFPLFKSIPEQDRTVLEFDISSIPDDSTINFAEFSFEMGAFITPSSEIDIIGYSGNGKVTTNDAEVSGQFLARFLPVELGQLSFVMDTDVVEENLAGDFVGIRLQSSGGDALNSSIDSNSGNLTVIYSTGSACSFALGDINLDGQVNLADIAPFVNRLATGGFQCEADLNVDGVVSLQDIAPFVELLAGG